MPKRRHLACFLFGVHTLLWAQNPLPQMPPPLSPVPGGMTAQPGMPAPFTPGEALSPPSSVAARRFTQLPTVAIREFRSSVTEISPRGATDMFVVALVKSRRFRVLERSRMAEGLDAEKALNQQGLTTGQSGQSQYLGVTYLFEATISEASAGDRQSRFVLGIAGANAGHAAVSDSIAVTTHASFE